MNHFSKTITITLFKQIHLEGMVNIDSDEYGFGYCKPFASHHGLQDSIGNSEKLLYICAKIAELAKEIDELHLK